MISELNKLGIALKALDGMNLMSVGVNTGNLDAFRTAIKGLSTEQAVFALASKGATEEQIRQILITKQSEAAEVEAALAKAGLTTATASLTQAEMVELATKSGVAKADAEALLSKIGITAAEEGQVAVKKQVTLAMLEQAVANGTLTTAESAQIATMLGLNAVETTNIGITNVLTGAVAKLWAVITAHPIGAILTAVGAVAIGVIAYINKSNKDAQKAIVETHEKAQQALDDTKTKLSDDKSELESVNSELETTKQKIQDIASQDSITLTEQNELDKLSAANTQLKTQKSLLENNIKLKQKAAALDAKNLLGTQVEMDYSDIQDGTDVVSHKESYTYAEHAKYEASNLKNAYNIYMSALKDGNSEKQKIAQELIDTAGGDTAELTSSLLEIIESFKYDDGTIIEGYEDLYNQYMGLIYNLQSLTNPDMFLDIAKQATQGTNIDYEKAISDGYAMAYDGEFNIDKLNQDFVKALADNGIDESTIEYIFKLKQQEYQSVVDNINQKYNPDNVIKPTYIEEPNHVDTLEQSKQNERDNQVYEQQKQEVQRVNDELTEYAKENPVEFQLVTSYDEDFTTLDKYIAEEKANAQNALQDTKNQLADLSKNGNVGLTIRPVIDSSAMQAAGWDVEDGSIATTFTQGEFIWQGDEENGQYVYVHYTPITPDGKVMTPENMSDYLYGTLEGAQNILDADDKGLVLKVDTVPQDISEKDIKDLQEKGTQSSSMKTFLGQMGQWDDSLHDVQAGYYLTGDSVDYVDKAVNRLVEDAKKAQDTTSNETPILSLSETITELDKVKEKMDVVDKTYAKLFNKDENIGFEDYSNIAEAFKDVSGIENYIDKLQKAGQNTEEVKKIMSSLTGAYIEQSGILDKVNEQNAGLIEQTLTEMGVENSHELVLQRLSAAKEIAALKSFDLANATTADILKLVEEGKVSEETANYLLQYALKKELANGTTLTTDSDIENIKKLVLALGGAIDELNAFQNAKNGVLRQLKNPNKTKKHTGNTKIFDEGSYSTESQEKAQDEIDSVLTKQYNYSGGSATSKAVNDAAKAAKDAAKDVKEAVAETFDFIENGINRFDKALSKLEDKVDKTSSSFTSRLNAYKEALNATTFGIELLTDDYNKYMQKANEVGLNEDIASAVRGGASNIWDYSDDTVKQQIKDYQNWYDKAQDCLDKIDELKDKQLELTQASIELLITQYEKLSTKVENANDRMEKWISLKESWGFSANTKNYNSMNKNIQKQIDYINKQDEQLKLLQKTVTKGSEAWYEYNERIDSNKASLIELKQQMQENATAAAVLAKATADKKTEKYDSQDELYDAKIDNATSAKSKNKLIDKKISNINKTQKAYNTAVSTDNKNLKSAKKTISKFKSTKENKKLLASIKKAAKSGKRISQSLLNKASKLNDNGKLYNACVQYNAYLDAKEADKATADLYKETAKQDKATLAKEKFDNISSDYENKISSNEQKKTSINNKISLAQEHGKQVSTAYYKSLISAEKGEKSKLIKERKKLQKSLNDAVISGSIKKGSDEWHEMVSVINEVTNAIDESTQSIVEFQNALRQLKWDTFDKSMETVKRINSENDYYIDLMSHKDMTDKDTGNFTKYGTATIGLHKTNYDNYLAQADEYQREYNKIMRQIEKGELSLSDENVVQRLRDLQDAHRDAKKSAEDELQSIQDLVKQGYEAQTDALSELIDKYKKLKDSELEAYKYQKEIAEKTKTIASLQKQLTAYNGNDSEESRAQIQKLKVQLEEAKNDLKDTQYEKFISDTEDMLDDLMNDYQEFINEKLNDTNNILDEIKTLLGSDIIETIKGLDSNLTNDTKDQIGSSTTNGGDGGQAAKDYVHNTVTNDQNKVNSKTDTSSYNPAKEADIAKKKNEIAQKKKAINEQRQSFQNQIKELESQLKQLYGELNSVENKYQFEKSSTKNKDKLQDLKNNYIEKKSGLNAMIQDVTHNKDVLQQFIADLDKQSAQLDTDLVSLKGYEKGSEHIDKSQLAWTQENKREMIYRASDGAVLTKLNPGDRVFTNEMTENLWELAKTNPSLLTSGINYMPNLPEITKSAGTSTIVEVGDIVMNGVNDVETFGRQLREEILRNGKTTQCITEAVSAKQLGKNGIGNARLYK